MSAKRLKALSHGYVLFWCDGKYFLDYRKAVAAVQPTGPTAMFGLHVWKGWRGFFYRME